MDTSLFFEHYYNNAQVNSIMIMDGEGMVLDINRAFTQNFGYNKEDIRGKNFTTLFIDKDKEDRIPQRELERVLLKGQSHDENYIINKDGHAVWCTGESLLAISKEGENYIIKDIINLQAKKQLQLFLKATDELLQRIFESSTDIPMMIVDGSMKIQKVNPAFLQLFEIDEAPATGARLLDLKHSFWKDENLKTQMRKILVDNHPIIEKEFMLQTRSGDQKQVKLNSKIIDRPTNEGKQIFILFEDVTNDYEH
jgi:PAS domain S-box-containing protein